MSIVSALFSAILVFCVYIPTVFHEQYLAFGETQPICDANVNHGTLGIQFVEQGTFQEAIAELSCAIISEPSNSDFYYFRAAAYYNLSHYRDSIADLTTGITLQPNDFRLYTARAAAYWRDRQFSLALSDYATAINLQPNDESLRISLALMYRFLENYEQVIQELTTTISLFPNSAIAYADRGFAYQNIDEEQLSLADLNYAYTLDSTIYLEFLERAVESYEDSDIAHAILFYDQAVAIGPDEAEPYYRRGSFSLFILGNYQQALHDFERTIELDPDNYEGAYGFAGSIYYFWVRDAEKALIYFEHYNTLAGSNTSIFFAYCSSTSELIRNHLLLFLFLNPQPRPFPFKDVSAESCMIKSGFSI